MCVHAGVVRVYPYVRFLAMPLTVVKIIFDGAEHVSCGTTKWSVGLANSVWLACCEMAVLHAVGFHFKGLVPLICTFLAAALPYPCSQLTLHLTRSCTAALDASKHFWSFPFCKCLF